MIGEKTRKDWERQEMEYRVRAVVMGNKEHICLDEIDTPYGKRLMVTTYIEALGCGGVGHAFLNAGDDLCYEVGVLLSGGRATRALGEDMVRKGLERSAQLDLCRKTAKEAAKKVVAAVNNKPENFDEHHHKKRLEDALRTGDVILCEGCSRYFGAARSEARRRVMGGGPSGMRPFRGRFHICPHCKAENPNIHDQKEFGAKVSDWIEKHNAMVKVRNRNKPLHDICEACSVDECPGWRKDPCDEIKKEPAYQEWLARAPKAPREEPKE